MLQLYSGQLNYESRLKLLVTVKKSVSNIWLISTVHLNWMIFGMSQDSSVKCLAMDLTVRVSFLAGEGILSLPPYSDWPWGSSIFLSSRRKHLEHGVDHSAPSGVKVNVCVALPPRLHVSS